MPSSRLVAGLRVTGLRQLAHEGNHATVWTGSIGDRSVIIKEHAMDASLIGEHIDDWLEYCSAINALASTTGISAAKNLGYEVDREQNLIRFVDQMATQPDVSRILNDKAVPIDSKMMLLGKLLHSLCAVPYDSSYCTDVMIDGEFSNFCPNDSGGFDYVDVFPAHCRDEHGNLLKPNAEHLAGKRSLALETFITGDIYGIVGRFWGMLRRDHALMWQAAPHDLIMQQALSTLPKELRDYCDYLFETDTAFVQAVYRHGSEHPRDMRLHDTLQHWASRAVSPLQPPFPA